MLIRPMEGCLNGAWGGAGIEASMEGSTLGLSPRSPGVFFWGLFAHPKSPRPRGERKTKRKTKRPKIPLGFSVTNLQKPDFHDPNFFPYLTQK
jgi:hypothetical protein